MVSGKYFFPNAPLLCVNRIPAASVISLNVTPPVTGALPAQPKSGQAIIPSPPTPNVTTSNPTAIYFNSSPEKFSAVVVAGLQTRASDVSSVLTNFQTRASDVSSVLT